MIGIGLIIRFAIPHPPALAILRLTLLIFIGSEHKPPRLASSISPLPVIPSLNPMEESEISARRASIWLYQSFQPPSTSEP